MTNTAGSCDEVEQEIKKWFMQSLHIGISLLQENAEKAKIRLTEARNHFYNYGLASKSNSTSEDIIERSLNHFLRNGGFSDQLYPSLAAWSMALNLGSEDNAQNPSFHLNKDQCEVIVKSIDSSILQEYKRRHTWELLRNCLENRDNRYYLPGYDEKFHQEYYRLGLRNLILGNAN